MTRLLGGLARRCVVTAAVVVACVTGWSETADAQIQRSFINTGFEQPVLPSTNCWSIRDSGLVDGWETTDFYDGAAWGTSQHGTCGGHQTTAPNLQPIDPMQIFRGLGGNNKAPFEGDQYAELNAYNPRRLYQSVCMVAGEEIAWSLAHSGRLGTDRMRFNVGPNADGSGSQTIVDASTTLGGVGTINSCGLGACSVTSSLNGWALYSGTFTWTGASGLTTVGFQSVVGGSIGNILDAISLNLTPFLQLGSGTGSGDESIPSANIPGIVVSGNITVPLSVSVTITGGTATLGADYTTPSGTNTFQVTVPAGNYDGTTVIPLGVTILNDGTVEADETISFQLGANPAAYTIASTQSCGAPPTPSATYTILDDDVEADLTISKTGTPNPYVPGTPFTYTIVVTNLGPDASNGATVADTLPALLAAFTWTCTATGGAVCGTANGTGPAISALVDLPAGGVATFLVTGTMPGGATGALTNTATITPPALVPDPNLANNTATDVNSADFHADLRVTKVSAPNPYVPGATLTYTVVVTNAGPSDVTGAVVNDPLPAAFAGFTWTCTGDAGAACVTPSGTGDINAQVNLPAGSTATFTSTGIVPSGYTASATNTATITPPPGVSDPVTGNNSSTVQNPPGPEADLRITKSQAPDPYQPGASLTYTLVVSNLGPSDAVNARVQDTVPGALTNVTWACAPSGTGATCGMASGVNVIDALVTLPAGTSATFTVDADAPASLTGTLINTATVAAPTGLTDPVPGNNTATVTSGPAFESDLAVVKTASPNPYVPGSPLTFTIVVSNAGPSNVANARVQDLFPTPLSGFEWTCAPSAGVATCGSASGAGVIDAFVDLAAGGAVTFTVTGDVPPDATGTLTNTATVAAPVDVRDPDSGNNSSAVGLSNGAVADLSVTKTSSPNPYVPGSPLTFTVVVSNAGPSAVTAARVRDIVPAAVQNVTWTCVASGGVCPAASGAGSLDAAVDVAPGGTVAFTFTGTVAPQTRGGLTNTASVVPPPGVVDPNVSDNAAVHANPSAPPPGGPADLQITQEHPGVAPPNGLLTFRLRTRNLGANTALNPYITGMIPPGTTFVSANPGPGGTCNVPGDPAAPDPVTGYPIQGAAAVEPLRCTWPGVMEVGDSHVVEFTVRVAPGAPTGQILWSCFWTWSDTPDPYHANNVVDGYLFVHDGVSPVGDLALQGATLTEGIIGNERPVRVGEAVPIRFWATNHGPAATRGQYALILDTANTVEIVSVKVPQGWISPSGPSSAVWDTGPVAPGQTVAVDLTVRLRTTTSVKLFAQRISGSPGDPNATNEHVEIVLDGYGPTGTAGRWVAVGNVDGADRGEVLTGAGEGETPQVRVFSGTGADTGLRFFAYERPFRGGVRIASCDVDGDGIDELITAPGPGRAPTIRVLGLAGGVVTELTAFDAFEPEFRGGAYVACADLDADGLAEVVVGAGPGRAPDVQVYNVGVSSVIPGPTFLAYEAGFSGGVRVAAGPYAGRAGWLDAFAIATTPGSGRAPELRLWTASGAPVAQLVASSATAGVLPTLGDVNGDGSIDLLLAPDNGRPELVRIFDVDSGTVIGDVPGGVPAFPVGVRLATGVLSGGPGLPEIVVGNGPGGHPRVRVIYWPPAGPVQRLEVLPLEIP